MENKICPRCSKEKPVSEFCKKKNGINSFCKECNKKYLKQHYNDNKQKYKDRNINRKIMLRASVNDLKRTFKCTKCPESDIACLDFHHDNPKEKDISIAWAINRGWSLESINIEIDKCIILCSNCHRKLHFYNSA